MSVITALPALSRAASMGITGLKRNVLSSGGWRTFERVASVLSLVQLATLDSAIGDGTVTNRSLLTSAGSDAFKRVVKPKGSPHGVLVDEVFIDRLVERVLAVFQDSDDEEELKEAVKTLFDMDTMPTVAQILDLVRRYPLVIFNQLMNVDISVGEFYESIIGESLTSSDKPLTRLSGLPQGAHIGDIDVSADDATIDTLGVFVVPDPTDPDGLGGLSLSRAQSLNDRVRDIEMSIGMSIEAFRDAQRIVNSNDFEHYLEARDRGLI